MTFFDYLKFFGGISVIAYAYFTNAQYQGVLEIIGTLIMITSGITINFNKSKK